MNENKEYSKEEIIKFILNSGEKRKFNDLEENLIHELIQGKVSVNPAVKKDYSTFGQKIADKVAKLGGSWTFIIIFIVILAVWIIINTIILSTKSFDPYPFIFLNLILSCISGIQAPIIMMSQNRQEEKDRITKENNYIINFKSEILVEQLHYKLDKLLENQEEITIIKKQLEDLQKHIETK